MGPPAPTGLSSSTGDTLFDLNWTPNVDPDTAGYDIYIGSVAQLTSGGAGGDGGYTLACTEAGASGGGGTGTGSAHAAVDASTTAMTDASADDARPPTVPSPMAPSPTPQSATPQARSETSAPERNDHVHQGGEPAHARMRRHPFIFSQSFVSDGGGSVTVPVTDDAGDDATTTIAATGGGISQIPTKYLVNANGTTTVTASSPSVGNYNVTGA